MRKFNSLIQVITHFADEQIATDHLIQLRWGGAVTCVHCAHAKVYVLQGATKRFKCAKCRKQFSATKGRIFEKSPLSLQLWFAAIWLITSHKKGISSHQLARDLKITQKSAWFVLHRVRHLLQSGSFEHKDGATIQMDETFVGGKQKNKHGYRSHWKDGQASSIFTAPAKKIDDKTPVIGLMEQGGNVIAQKVQDVKGKTLYPFLDKHVRKSDATVVTDQYSVYHQLAKLGYNHVAVNHLSGQYTLNGFHTNGIENFWSLFKRGIIGIYHQVSEKHLDKYIDEFEFRYNNRKLGEADRFDKLLTLCNKRLTYPQLIQKEAEQ